MQSSTSTQMLPRQALFENCYTEIVNQMSTMGNVFKDVYGYQQLAVEQAESNRQSVIGVSSDEELEHMIMYQGMHIMRPAGILM